MTDLITRFATAGHIFINRLALQKGWTGGHVIKCEFHRNLNTTSKYRWDLVFTGRFNEGDITESQIIVLGVRDATEEEVLAHMAADTDPAPRPANPDDQPKETP